MPRERDLAEADRKMAVLELMRRYWRNAYPDRVHESSKHPVFAKLEREIAELLR